MTRAKRITCKAAGLGLLIISECLSAQDDNAALLNPLGPVPAETVEILEAREPISELGRPRSYYLAGSEKLAKDEMRVIALGSSNTRVQRVQASPCWLIELGNGDSFIFDIGTRCTVGLSMLEVPWDTFTKVFLTHLHADHIGDLPALLAGGWDMGRSIPIEVWGPSGAEPDLGTQAMVEHALAMYRWEYVSKLGRGGMSSYAIKVHEIDYSKEQTIYKKNGVRIKSWPALHTIDGAVSYSLEWNGLKLSYSGDTVQNKWFLKHAKDSDIVIHECSPSLKELIEEWDFPPEAAWTILKTAHTQARQAAEVFKILKPKMAICTHYAANGVDKSEKLYAEVKKHYAGAFMVAKDRLVWNVTPEEIRVSTLVGGDYNAGKLPRAQESPDTDKLTKPSKWLQQGEEVMIHISREQLNGLKPEHRKRILERVSKDLLP